MGWAHCGLDDLGREIGYAVDASCDQEGCAAEINRGLGCVCGGMHGGGKYGCGRYFCGDHLSIVSKVGQLCEACAKAYYEIEEPRS